MNLQELERKALDAANRCLKSKGYIALDDVFAELGALTDKQREDWRFGRVPCLECVIQMNLSRVNAVCRAVHASARHGNPKASWTAHVKWGKGARTPLRFTKSGDPKLERAWATRYLRPEPKRPSGETPSTPASEGNAVGDKPGEPKNGRLPIAAPE